MTRRKAPPATIELEEQEDADSVDVEGNVVHAAQDDTGNTYPCRCGVWFNTQLELRAHIAGDDQDVVVEPPGP